MKKYITIPDIRSFPSYNNINARLLYLHVASGMDVNTRNYAHSWRQLSDELCMPLQQLRTALKQLERDGLVVTQNVTQRVTYGLTHKVTHKVTEIHILSINELDEATNEATNSPTNSPTNSQSNSQSNSENNNINNKIIKSSTLTDARACWPKMVEDLKNTLHLGEQDAAQIVEDFRARQRLKSKTWESEGDLLAHVIAWAEKRMPPVPRARANTRADDAKAREDERRRTEEEVASRSAEETARLEIARLKRIKATVPLDASALEDLENEIRKQEAVLAAAS